MTEPIPLTSNRCCEQDVDLKRIGYAQCEVDTWNAIESANLSLAVRLQLIAAFNEAKRIREVTQFQLTESDLNAML